MISNPAVVTGSPAVVATLRAQPIELPSWALGNSGMRFKVFAQMGVPRDPCYGDPIAAERVGGQQAGWDA